MSKFLSYKEHSLNENLKNNADKILSSNRAFLLLAVYNLCECYDWKISSTENVIVNLDKIVIPITVKNQTGFYSIDNKNKIEFEGARGKTKSSVFDSPDYVYKNMVNVFKEIDKTRSTFCYDYRNFYFPVGDWTFKFPDFNAPYGYFKTDTSTKRINIGDSVQLSTNIGLNLGLSVSRFVVTCIKGHIDEFFYRSANNMQEIGFYAFSGVDTLVEQKLGVEIANKLSYIPVLKQRLSESVLHHTDINLTMPRSTILKDILNIPDKNKDSSYVDIKGKMLSVFSDDEKHKYRGSVHGKNFGL